MGCSQSPEQCTRRKRVTGPSVASWSVLIRTISGTELVEGATAELIVRVSSNGRRHAISVSRIGVAPEPSDLIVSGEIERVTADHIVIGGQTIPITDATFLKGQPKKGKKVSVRISNTEAGAVAAGVSAALLRQTSRLSLLKVLWRQIWVRRRSSSW